ncbi:MAG TPA: pyridoxamine 5'-phosphate oxidase family protein [Burkholderiales bacterium]|nr:pyridoxamine 5'-phosphate oxidase family protein [Burkholderiales bacterium]
MGQRFSVIGDRHRSFIERQRVFFVATATAGGRVNVSPKGMDALRVLDPGRVAWLNLTGSGNETAAHLLENDRMTVMFCAFEGAPMILRLYGHAAVLHRRDAGWADLAGMFPALAGARQIIDLHVDLVQTSCGLGLPLFDYREQRDGLEAWARGKGADGIRRYWEEKNRLSLDGKATGVLES